MDSSRYTINREIRTVLVRHAVDVARVEYTFTGKTAYIRGELHKLDGGEFTASGIEDMARDIARIRSVRDIFFDVKNWNITTSGDSWLVTKSKKASSRTGASAADTTIEIREEDIRGRKSIPERSE